MIKGLSQDDDVFITEDGQFFPLSESDRAVEMERMGDDCLRPSGLIDPTSLDHLEEEVQEGFVKARLPPKEPTEAERLRHEATHIPYRAWCPQCVALIRTSGPMAPLCSTWSR